MHDCADDMLHTVANPVGLPRYNIHQYIRSLPSKALTAIEILVNVLQPAQVVMCVADDMNIQHVLFPFRPADLQKG